MAPDQPELDGQDGQDVAEVFDEDNLDSDSMRLARDDEELNFDNMPDVYDATRADGDEDDDDAVIGDDLDDDQIVELSLQDEDEDEDEEDDDDYRGLDSLTDDEEGDDEVELSYAGDLNTVAGAHSGAQRYESRSLSDEDLAELGYRAAPSEPKTFQKPDQSVDQAKAKAQSDHEDEQLDSGLEETFPASDPVSVKHIT